MPMTVPRLEGSTACRVRTLFFWFFLAFRVALCLVGVPFASDQEASRIVAIGDIHGRWDRLVNVMEKAALLDDHLRWSGGDSTFVVVGDFMDRGPKVRPVMDLLMRLQEEAPKHHGEVVVLLGNHEMMNITGDYRYVTPEIFASFADKDSEERRRDAYRHYQSTLAQQIRLLGASPFEELGEDDWMQSHPPGFVEYTEAIGPKGEYGKWLRDLPVIVKIDDTVFVHGGIHPSIQTTSIKDLNKRIEQEREVYDDWKGFLVRRHVLEPFYTIHESLTAARAYLDHYSREVAWDSLGQTITSTDQLVRVLGSFLKIGDWLSTHPDGPLWFRGYAKWTDEEGELRIGPLLERYGARRFVVGHTMLGEDIVRRFEDRVILIDSVRPSALEIGKDGLREIYVEQQEPDSVEDMVETPALP